MQNILRIVLVGTILWAASLLADDKLTVVEGRSDMITQEYIMIGQQRYPVIYPVTKKSKADAKLYGFETKCWRVESSSQRYPIDYISLVHVGYADLVRLTLKGNMVRTVEVLDLQQ